MLQNGVPHRCACAKLSAGGGGLSHHLGEVQTSLKRYCTIWGIAAIVSHFRAYGVTNRVTNLWAEQQVFKNLKCKRSQKPREINIRNSHFYGVLGASATQPFNGLQKVASTISEARSQKQQNSRNLARLPKRGKTRKGVFLLCLMQILPSKWMAQKPAKMKAKPSYFWDSQVSQLMATWSWENFEVVQLL